MESLPKIELFINHWDRGKFMLLVDEGMSFHYLKSLALQKLGQDQQFELQYWCQKLDEGKTLKDYEIKRQYTLEMAYSEFQIHIRSIMGQQYTITTAENQLIKDVKKTIYEISGISEDIQGLTFRWQKLENSKAIGHYHIEAEAVLNLAFNLRGGQAQYIRLNGETFFVEYNETDRVLDIKKRIQKEKGFEPETQKLSFKGKELIDYKTLMEQGIKDQELDLVILKNLIYGTVTGYADIKFRIGWDSKVSELKKIIEEQTGIAPTIMILNSDYDGDENALLLDEDQTKQYCMGQTISLKMEIGYYAATLNAYFDGKDSPFLLYFDKLDFTYEEILLQLERKFQMSSDRLKLLRLTSNNIQKNYQNGYVWIKEYQKIYVFIESGINFEFILTLEFFLVKELLALLEQKQIKTQGCKVLCDGKILDSKQNLVELMKNKTVILYLTYQQITVVNNSQFNPHYLHSSQSLANQFLAVMYSTNKSANSLETINMELQACCQDTIPIPEDSMPLLQYSIKEYSGNRYSAINKALSQENYLQLRSFLCSLLSDLDHHQHQAYKDSKTYLYRGIKKAYLNLDDYKVGKRLYWTSFSSTSQSIDVAKRFSGKEGIIFFVKVAENKPYHNIQLLPEWSYYPQEKEVLLFPNFYFQIKKVETKRGYTHIYIEEIPFKNLLNIKKLNQIKVLWYDAYIYSVENCKYQKQLSQQFSNIEFIDNEQEFLLSLNQGIDCVVMISGSTGKALVPQIHQIQALRSVIVFTSVQSLEKHKLWANEYSKVKKVIAKFDEAIAEIMKEDLSIPCQKHNSDDDYVLVQGNDFEGDFQQMNLN